MSMKMTLDLALKMIEAAEVKSKSIKVPMIIAVVDDGTNLVAQHRMDDAILASIDISYGKAFTAAATKMPTHVLGEAAQTGGPLFGLNTTNNGKIVIFGGGYPVTNEKGEVIGAIGVSGGSIEEDMACAEAGLGALK
jgi:uncharacterized protein GlcG (DUF336 family)